MNYWADVPMGKGDFQRGKQYAKLTIAAVQAVAAASIPLNASSIRLWTMRCEARRARQAKEIDDLREALELSRLDRSSVLTTARLQRVGVAAQQQKGQKRPAPMRKPEIPVEIADHRWESCLIKAERAVG
jgi:hypothetical protein